MKSRLKNLTFLIASVYLLQVLGLNAATAQIVPAADGTGTLVAPDGNRIDIGGGTLSADQANLFHSFTQFGLNQSQIANFLSQPNIENILARVVGGNPSVINGLLQVTGGHSNLYLLNPAGIIFGNTASLNVPASFVATTANGIGFNGGWFGTSGTNYAALTGNPTGFNFPTDQPGAIVNAGTLAVPTGESLALMGGTIVNTGSLTAPGGNITVMSVPGQSLVRLSQPGSLLSLEIQPSSGSGITALSLPALLTGPGAGQATGLSVTSTGDVVLSSSGGKITTDPGTSTVTGTVDVSNSNGVGGTAHLLGRQVALVGAAQVDASGTSGGGTVLVGGGFQGNGPVPNAENTVVGSAATLKADAIASGNGGTAIIWSDGSTRYYGTITARGGATSGNGGSVEVSGKDWLDFQGNVDLSAVNGAFGTLLLDPTNLTIAASGPDIAGNGTGLDLTTPNLSSAAPGTNSIITVGAVNTQLAAASVSLGATSTINVNATGVSIPTARTLTLDAPTINLNAGITQVGGDPTSVLAGTGTTVNVTAATVPLQNGIDVAASGGTVNVTTNGSFVNTTGIIRKPLTLAATNGATLTGTTGIQIGDTGIANLNNVTVRGFRFNNNTGGISIFGGTATTNATIANNTFTNATGATNPLIFSFNPNPQTNLTISGNTFSGITPALPAIRLNNIQNSTISGNTITGFPVGIQLDGVANSTISNNIITNSSQIGIQLADVVRLSGGTNLATTGVQITNNTIANAALAGIVLYNGNMGGTAANQQIVVSNNAILNSNRGVFFANTNVAALSGGPFNANNFKIINNAFEGNTTTAIYTGNDATGNGTLDLTGNWWGANVNPTLGGAGPSTITGNAPAAGVILATNPRLSTNRDARTGTAPSTALAGFLPLDYLVLPIGTTFPNVCFASSGLGCIQQAINLATPFTPTNINISAGTYTGDATTPSLNIPVNKDVGLYGPNQFISGSGARVPEAVISTSGTNSSILISSANGSDVAGLTLEGNNSTQFGIINGTPTPNTNISNNIIRNYTQSGAIFGASSGPGVSTGSTISGNLVQNPGALGGIVLTDNFYADVTNNVVQQAGIGIRVEQFRVAGAPMTISGNTVTSSRFGIFINSLFQNPSPITVQGNTLQTAAGASGTNIGIGATSIQNGAVVSFANNNISGARVGLSAFNNTATTPVTVTGGTLSGNQVGVRLYNLEPALPAASQNAIGPSTLILDGVTIQNSSDTGLYVQDNSPNTNNDVTLIVRNGSTITGGQTGLRAEGQGAFVQFPGGTPSASFSGQSGDYITLVNNPNDIDARTVQFNGITGAQAVAQGGTTLADIQAKITDKNDNSALGLVLLFTPATAPTRPSQADLYRFLVDFEGRVITFRPFILVDTADVLCRRSGFLPDTDDNDEDAIPSCIEGQGEFKVPKKMRGRKKGHHLYYRPLN